jgi:uncharacterized membrane protein
MKKKVKERVIKKRGPGFIKLVHPIFTIPRTIGQITADALTKWAGSWTFIILFFVFIGVWISTNGYFLLKYFQGGIFDPYPFILLNLALSCLAAIQAPIILMSQNRENQRDRLRSQYDYAVNRKAEKEIQDLKKQLNRIEKVMMKRRK